MQRNTQSIYIAQIYHQKSPANAKGTAQ